MIDRRVERVPEVVAEKPDPKAASPMVDSSRKGSLLPSRTSTAGTGAPASFYCPISMELMADPVMVATGHTYDRCWSSVTRGGEGAGEVTLKGPLPIRCTGRRQCIVILMVCGVLLV